MARAGKREVVRAVFVSVARAVFVSVARAVAIAIAVAVAVAVASVVAVAVARARAVVAAVAVHYIYYRSSKNYSHLKKHLLHEIDLKGPCIPDVAQQFYIPRLICSSTLPSRSPPTTDIAATATTVRHIPGVSSSSLSPMHSRWRWRRRRYPRCLSPSLFPSPSLFWSSPF